MKRTQKPWMHIAAVAAACGLAGSVTADPKHVKDGDLDSVIRKELKEARNVSAEGIKISIKDGEVTLKGEAANLLQKQRAERVASRVKGVRLVHNEMKVKDSGMSDVQVRNDVIAALANDPATDSWEIKPQVDGGEVTLEGRVESYAERALAEKVAMSVKGVRDVENKIDVDYVTYRPDSEIRQDILQRLHWNARVHDGQVDVKVNDGKVTLSGAVGSYYEHATAEGLAWVAGVKNVTSKQLEVRSDSRHDMARDDNVSDKDVQAAVERTLKEDARVRHADTTVKVNDGIVTLSGEVDNLKARRAAAQRAADTMGVRDVRNNIEVKTASKMSDDDVERKITDALRRDAVIDRTNVSVDVVDGKAHLRGKVDSYYARAQAEDIAARTNGVTSIQNDLTVAYTITPYTYYLDWDPVEYDYDYDYETVSTRPDREILDEIESELFWSPFVDSDDVTVTVKDGVATLTGTVDSWSERSSATENAIEGGAVQVFNKLDVN